MRLDKRTFVSLVEEAMQGVPTSLAQHLDGVVIEVEPVPDRSECRDRRSIQSDSARHSHSCEAG